MVNTDPRALLLLVPCVSSWVLAYLLDIAVIQQLCMVALIPIVIWLSLGLPITRLFAFPLAYLFFAVPLGQSLIPPMMEFTADMTVYLVQLSGVPVFREGLYFQLPTGSWAVVEECSGVRYLIASAALGTIYAYNTYSSAYKRLLFVIVSLIVPIIANGLRAYGIVMIGHVSGMSYAVGADHLLYGWVFFGIVIFILFWLGGFWADFDENHRADEIDTVSRSGLTRSARLGPAVAVLTCLLVINFATAAVKFRESTLDASANLKLPARVGTWELVSSNTPTTHWKPIFENPTRSASMTYRTVEASVDLAIAYFDVQKDGAEAISSLNRLSDPYEGEWKLTSQENRSEGVHSITETVLSRAGDKINVWSTYLVGGQYEAQPINAKVLQAKQLLRGNQSASWITLATDHDEDLEELRARLGDAWTSLSGPVAQSVSQLSQGR